VRPGECQTAEYRRQGKNGREVWVLATHTPIPGLDGQPVEVVTFATDITAAKLRNADFEGQIDAINKSQAVIQFTMDGTILDANQNFLKAIGCGAEEVRGKHHSMFVEPGYAGAPEYQEFWGQAPPRRVPLGRLGRC
jgi:methyl-accepting chemotaxis protein